MQGLVAVGAVALVAVPFMFWNVEPQVLASAARSLVPGADPPIGFTITPRIHLLAAAAVLPSLGVGLFALWQLWHLFGAYGRGVVFGTEATLRLRRFGWALIATALLRPLTQTAVVLLLTLHNPPGQRHLVVTVDWQDYLALLFGGLLMAMAWAMAEASAIEQENASFV